MNNKVIRSNRQRDLIANIAKAIIMNYHFFLGFLGFLILRLAGGIGILSPSSAGSVCLVILRISFIFLAFSLTSLNFYSEILGVKLRSTVRTKLRLFN